MASRQSLRRRFPHTAIPLPVTGAAVRHEGRWRLVHVHLPAAVTGHALLAAKRAPDPGSMQDWFTSTIVRPGRGRPGRWQAAKLTFAGQLEPVQDNGCSSPHERISRDHLALGLG